MLLINDFKAELSDIDRDWPVSTKEGELYFSRYLGWLWKVILGLLVAIFLSIYLTIFLAVPRKTISHYRPRHRPGSRQSS